MQQTDKQNQTRKNKRKYTPLSLHTDEYTSTPEQLHSKR